MDKISSKNCTICMISPFPPAKTGVAEYCYKLTRALSNYCQIVIFTEDRYKQKNWGGNPIIFRTWTASYSIKTILKCISNILKTFKMIARHNCSVIHIQYEPFIFGSYGLILLPFLMILIKQFLRSPILLTMHTVIPLTTKIKGLAKNFEKKVPTKQKILILFIYTRLIAKLSNKVIVHSDHSIKILEEHYRLHEEKIFLLKHGFTVITPLPKELAKNRLHFPHCKIILFHGFLKSSKGVHNIIKAISRISEDFPEIRFVIAGGSPIQGAKAMQKRLTKNYSKYLQNLAQELGVLDKIVFLNKFIDEEKLIPIISASDIIVLPYEKQIFGVSGVFYKVSCYEKPVIASDIPIFREVIKNGETGILVPPDNPVYLAKAMEFLLSKPNLARKLGQNLRRQSIKYGWEKAAEIQFILYKSFLSNKLKLKSG
jgi:glycosyltransferase involved in cell wall biosynthesis